MSTSGITGRLPRRFIARLALVLLLGACGDGGEVGADGDTAPTAVPGPGEPPDEPSLPGERIDIFPYAGAELMVVGVAADDTLNVRAGPGVTFDVVFELDPLARGLVASGHNRQLDPGGVWSEITVDGRTGWAHTAFLLHPGPVHDITAELWPDPADRPRAESMLELGHLVAEQRTSRQPPSEVVVVDGPTVGDLGEITVDVIGLGDDAVGGERLRVFAQPDEGGAGFVLRTVEAMSLCTRGVTDGGLCV